MMGAEVGNVGSGFVGNLILWLARGFTSGGSFVMYFSCGGGFCLFSWADAHPAVSWSVLDHERTPKAAFAAVVESLAKNVIGDLIAAQRAYEMNGKVITAADQMLSSTANIFR